MQLTLAPPEFGARILVGASPARATNFSSPAETFLAARSAVWLWFWKSIAGERGAPVFDELAVRAAAHEDIERPGRAYLTTEGELRFTMTDSGGGRAVLIACPKGD
jgi:hypothetical protein